MGLRCKGACLAEDIRHLPFTALYDCVTLHLTRLYLEARWAVESKDTKKAGTPTTSEKIRLCFSILFLTEVPDEKRTRRGPRIHSDE